MDIRERLLERRVTLREEMNALAGALQQLDWTLEQLDAIEAESNARLAEGER
jgi:hypothetical protein